MKINTIQKCVIVFLSTLSVAIADQAHPYVRLDGGASGIAKAGGNQFKIGGVYSVGAGYQFNDIFRTDLNIQYRKPKTEKSIRVNNSQLQTCMLNGYVNLTDSADSTIPYVFAGIGYGVNKLNSFIKTADSYTLQVTGKTSKQTVWNVGLGAMFSMTDQLNLDISYRYADLGKLKGDKVKVTEGGSVAFIDFVPVKLKAHEVMAGLVYKF